MSIPDDQIELLSAAVGVLRDLQTTATGAGAQVRQVVMEFPPTTETNLVQFTWDEVAEKFNIATLP